MPYRADTDEEIVPRMPRPKDYQSGQDHTRLARQHRDIKTLMLDGVWRTVKEISEKLSYPETSVSAQIRHLRRPKFGSWTVNRRRRLNSAVSEYQLKEKKVELAKDLFGDLPRHI